MSEEKICWIVQKHSTGNRYLKYIFPKIALDNTLKTEKRQMLKGLNDHNFTINIEMIEII